MSSPTSIKSSMGDPKEFPEIALTHATQSPSNSSIDHCDINSKETNSVSVHGDRDSKQDMDAYRAVTFRNNDKSPRHSGLFSIRSNDGDRNSSNETSSLSRRKSLVERQKKRYANRHISQGDTDDDDEDYCVRAKKRKRLKDYRRQWIRSVAITIIIAGIAMLPGIICRQNGVNCISILGQPVFLYSLFIAAATVLYIAVKIFTVLLFFVLQRLKATSTRISYYARHLERPFQLILWTVSVYLTWVFYFRNELEGLQEQIRDIEGPFFTSLFIFGIGHLVYVIAIRYIFIIFFKAAYCKQIFNAVFIEYVLSAILHRYRDTHETLKKKVIVDTVHKINIFSNHSGDSYQMKLGSLKLGERDATNSRNISNLDLSILVQNFQENPYIQCIHGEIESLSKKHGKREALDIYARRIFDMAKQDDETEELTEAHFTSLFENPKLAKRAFNEFDVNRDGNLTKEEFHAAFVSLYKQRRALAKTLVEGEGAVKKLSVVVTILALSIYIILILGVFKYDVTGLLVTISSMLLAMSFAFSTLLRNAVNSITFLFFSHPFDIGDRISIDGVTYTVAKMNILGTEFLRYDHSWVFFPNQELFGKEILNHNRSPDQVDIVEIEVDYSTTMEKITELESRLHQFSSEYSNHYYREMELEIREVDDLNKMILRIWIRHRGNFQNMKRYRSRRSFAMLNIKHILEKLEISYQIPTQKIAIPQLRQLLDLDAKQKTM